MKELKSAYRAISLYEWRDWDEYTSENGDFYVLYEIKCNGGLIQSLIYDANTDSLICDIGKDNLRIYKGDKNPAIVIRQVLASAGNYYKDAVELCNDIEEALKKYKKFSGNDYASTEHYINNWVESFNSKEGSLVIDAVDYSPDVTTISCSYYGKAYGDGRSFERTTEAIWKGFCGSSGGECRMPGCVKYSYYEVEDSRYLDALTKAG